MRWLILFVVCLWLSGSSSLSVSAEDSPGKFLHQLDEFGPTATPAQIQSTWQAAIKSVRTKGGIIVVPSNVWPQLKAGSLQGLIRTPEAPQETKQWKTGAGASILTATAEQPLLRLPPLSGMKIERPLRLDVGDSLPHWGTHPMITLDSDIVSGSSSYLDWLQAPVAKGNDAKFYVPTVRGLFPGQFLNVHGGMGYGGGVTRACVKSLGYDTEKKLHYFVADTKLDHVAGSIAHNKSNTGLIHMTQTSNNDNQTYDVKVIRNQYAHGDTYIYYCDFNYMSNVHSAAGDENGNCYAAFIRSQDNNFKGAVEKLDPAAGQLTFTNAAANVDTLGNSRPLINLNPKKHITDGKVVIVTGRSDFDLPVPEMSVFNGVNYSTELTKSAITGSAERKFGGLIRGDKDCPWTEAVVGRFFAVTNTDEKTPKGNFRWYLITAFKANDDGTKDIEIQRFWWGAKSAGGPTLYRKENYTWDGHERPLSYSIAPGAYVNDVSRAVTGGERGGQRTLGMSPHSAQGTAFDFEPRDRIEQAIGPDPFKPQAMRVWMWEDVPGQFPAAVFDVANNGAASRYSVLSIAGGPSNLDDIPKRAEQKPAWDNFIVANTAATNGLNFKADFANAALLFQQPNREQPIKWHYGQQPAVVEDSPKTGITRAVTAPATSPKVATLTVSRATGEFQFEGGGVQAGGPVSGVAGLSGDQQPAKNLRGKNVSVTETALTFRVLFPRPEADGEYAVFVEQSWLTNRAISDKGPAGFTVTFDKPAPSKATLDWMLVR